MIEEEFLDFDPKPPPPVDYERCRAAAGVVRRQCKRKKVHEVKSGEKAVGLCEQHYTQWRRGKALNFRVDPPAKETP
jgi:hypothetical protein